MYAGMYTYRYLCGIWLEDSLGYASKHTIMQSCSLRQEMDYAVVSVAPLMVNEVLSAVGFGLSDVQVYLQFFSYSG